jgi:hypothetical protein
MTRSHRRPKPGKGNMQEETKKKKEKNAIKVRDLKPVKDAKGGIIVHYNPGGNPPTHNPPKGNPPGPCC